MLKVQHDPGLQTVSVSNETETWLYKNAELKFFYDQQIAEIHSEGKFVAILPIGRCMFLFTS